VQDPQLPVAGQEAGDEQDGAPVSMRHAAPAEHGIPDQGGGLPEGKWVRQLHDQGW
jgi:hypothetical protein